MITLETIFTKTAQTVAVLFIILALATFVYTFVVLLIMPLGSAFDFSHFNILIGRKLTADEINQILILK